MQMFNDQWRYVEAFTVDQVAFLCCDLEPNPKQLGLFVMGERPAGVEAARQLLLGAIHLGELSSKSKYPIANTRADGEDIVTRDDLIRFAQTKNLLPAFLFDTIAPQKTSAQLPASEVPKNVGGRPEEFDWNLMHAEIVRCADMDELPKKQAELIEHLLQWFANGMLANNPAAKEYPVPSETSVKTRVSSLYRNLYKLGWKSE
jgi:hypothetical protein